MGPSLKGKGGGEAEGGPQGRRGVGLLDCPRFKRSACPRNLMNPQVGHVWSLTFPLKWSPLAPSALFFLPLWWDPLPMDRILVRSPFWSLSLSGSQLVLSSLLSDPYPFRLLSFPRSINLSCFSNFSKKFIMNTYFNT